MKQCRLSFLIFLVVLVFSCSHQSPEYAATRTFSSSDIDVSGGDEVLIRVTGIKGEKGDPGETGDAGPPGPQGPPGTGSGGGIAADVWVNVKLNGAVGDGKTDDTKALKAIFSKAEKDAVILFPRGIYKVSETLVNDRNLNLIGMGLGSKIYQSADATLIDVTSQGLFRVSDLWLASAAKSKDTALIRVTANASHIELDNLALTGSYYGIYLRGVLFPKLTSIKEADPWSSSFPTYMGRAGIYAEYYGARAINALTIINPVFQGGWDRAIWVKDHSETGVTIIGGCLEAMREAAVVLDGVGHYTNIIGTHFEGNEGTVQLNGCSQVNMSGTLGIGRYGVIARSCRRVGIREAYLWSLDVDDTNWNVSLQNVFYKTLKLGARMVDARNFNCTDNASLGPFGTYTSDIPDSIVDGSLENWVNGKPVGFSTYGSVTQDTTTVFEGKSAAKVAWTQIAGLVYDVPAKYLKKGGVMTVMAMCYKPTGGFNPRIAAIYDDWSGTTIFPTIDLRGNEWTVIRATFNVPPNVKNMKIVLPSGYAPGQPGQELFVDWITIAPSH